jgi:hypothetical protein
VRREVLYNIVTVISFIIDKNFALPDMAGRSWERIQK